MRLSGQICIFADAILNVGFRPFDPRRLGGEPLQSSLQCSSCLHVWREKSAMNNECTTNDSRESKLGL